MQLVDVDEYSPSSTLKMSTSRVTPLTSARHRRPDSAVNKNDDDKAPLTVEEFGEDTDFHGIKRILRKDYGIARRLVWAFFFVCGLALLTWNLVDRFIYYFSYPHVTTVDILYESKIDFPAVTICNMNQFRQSALTAMDLLHFGQTMGILNSTYQLTHPDHYNESFVNFVRGLNFTELALNDTDDFDVEDFYNRTGHKVENMVLHCSWKGEECSPSNFTHVFTHLGNCYTFNKHHEDKYETHKAGSGNGLKLYLNLEMEEYLEYKGAADAGFKVLVHAQEDPPYIKELGFGLAPGMHHFVALRKMEITNLPPPWGNCYDVIPKYYPHYGVPACRIECEMETVVAKCGCKLVESPGNFNVCMGHKYLDCALPALEDVEHSESCVCQNPCTLTEYDHKISMTKIRESTIANLQADNDHIDKNTMGNNLIILNVYYEGLSYETIEQKEAFTVVDLLASIGGALGLYIGASVLTVLHLVEFVGASVGNKVTGGGSQNTQQLSGKV